MKIPDRKKILLVGFSKYGDYSANSTELILKELNGRRWNGFKIHSRIFPADIPTNNRGHKVFEIARKLKACGIVCLGMSSSKRGFCVEKRAINHINDARYCPKELLSRCVDPSHTYGQRIEIDLRHWVIDQFDTACRNAHICEIAVSEDAGSFCCNHLMFQMYLAHTQFRPFASIPWIFVNVPCCPEAIVGQEDQFKQAGKVTMSVNQMALGVKLLLAGPKF